MKNKLLGLVLFLTLQASAQNSTFISKEFWYGKPSLESVKSASTGFDFAAIENASTDPVYMAINSGAPNEAIKYLLDQPGVDLKRTVHEGRIYLHVAASKGNAEITDYLIKKGSDVYFLDANKQTALTFSGFAGSLTLPVLEVFVKNGVDVNRKYEAKDGANLFLLTIGNDADFSLTDYMVSKGVSVFSTDNKGNNAFYYAVKMGNIDLLKKLLSLGVKTKDEDLLSAAQGTFRSVNKLETYQFLVDELQLNPLYSNDNKQNVLHYILKKQAPSDVIAYFVNKGVDVNQTDGDGNIPFIQAAGVKDLATVTLLLSKVKDLNTINRNGETALMYAARSSNADVVSFLIGKGAKTTVLDVEGNTIIDHLINGYRAAEGRQRGSVNNDPMAGPTEFAEKLKVLKNAGIDIDKLKDGNTLYHIAVTKNDLNLVKQLATFGVDVNAVNAEGLTALHKAAMLAKDTKTLSYLVSIGAKKDVKSSFDETAFDLASENEFLTRENVALDFLK